MKATLVFLVYFVCYLYEASALECYSCSIGEQDTDTTCVDDPVKLGTSGKTNCNKKYCTTIRQEFKDPQNKVASMYRGCEDQPLHMNEIIEDETYRFYYTACQETLCNGGSGKASTGGSTSSLGDKSTLIVPGIGGATDVVLSTSLFFITTLTAYFML